MTIDEQIKAALKEKIEPAMLEHSDAIFKIICDLCEKVFMEGIDMGINLVKK